MGFCAIYKHFSGFGFFLLSGIFPARPQTTNASRYLIKFSIKNMSPIKSNPIAAPRLRAYLRATEGALIMLRQDWEKLKALEGKPIEIDISISPLAAILITGQVVASFTQQISKRQARILIFRDDPEDTPFNINLDRYRVFEDFRSRPDYLKLVTSSSTADDQTMQDFHNEYVIITQEIERRGHHLRELPGIYKAQLLKKNSKEASPSRGSR